MAQTTSPAELAPATQSLQVPFNEAIFRAALRRILGAEVYEAWCASLKFSHYCSQKRVATLSVAINFLQRWLIQNYEAQLLVALRHAMPSDCPVDAVRVTSRALPLQAPIQIAASSKLPLPSPAPARVIPMQTELPVRTHFTFERLCVYTGNRVAHNLVSLLVDSHETHHNRIPIWVHSSWGLGKTHLLHACAAAYHQQGRVVFLHAPESREAVCLDTGFMDPDNTVVLCDDVDILSASNRARAHDLLSSALARNVQVVVTASVPPTEAEQLPRRLRHTLGAGHVLEMLPFDNAAKALVFEEVVRRLQMQYTSFAVPSELVADAFDSLPDNGYGIEGFAHRLLALFLADKELPSREVVAQLAGVKTGNHPERRIGTGVIQRTICEYFHISKADLLSQRRTRPIVWPRQIGMYLTKQVTNASLPEIGRRFGGKDHTTVLHAIRRVEERMAKDEGLPRTLEHLAKMVKVRAGMSS